MPDTKLQANRELLFRVYAHLRATRQEVGDLSHAVGYDHSEYPRLHELESQLNDDECYLERLLERLPPR